MTGLAILATILALLLVWLGFAVRRAAHRRTAARADYFSKVLPLFDRVVTRIEPTGFPRVTGHLGPHAFDLQALPDSLTFRKLPTLWVMVTLPEPMPVKATLDILARAHRAGTVHPLFQPAPVAALPGLPARRQRCAKR